MGANFILYLFLLAKLARHSTAQSDPVLHALVDDKPIPGNVLYTRGTVQITCSPPPLFNGTLSWYLLDSSGKPTKFASGAILRTRQRYAETKTYTCQEDADNAKTGNATVIAISASYRGDIEKTPRDQIVKYTDPGILNCKLNRNDPNWKLIWKKNGQDLNCDGKYNCKLDEEGELTILEDSTGGFYACHFMDDQTTQAVEFFEVHTPPYMESHQPGINKIEGELATVVCDVTGYPPPMATWFKDGQPLAIDGAKLTTERSASGIKDGQLIIANLTFDDRAEYTCVTTNDYGTAQTVTLVRVKDSLAALWPALGIVAEVLVLFLIIFVHEKRRTKRELEEERKDKLDFERFKRMRSLSPGPAVQTLLLQDEGTTTSMNQSTSTKV